MVELKDKFWKIRKLSALIEQAIEDKDPVVECIPRGDKWVFRITGTREVIEPFRVAM
jgi:hypothetical protein